MPITIRTSLSREEVKRRIRQLPAILAGRVPDTHRIGEAFASAYAHSLMTRIHAEYTRKSLGKEDSTGMVWKPLAESTKARKIRKGQKPPRIGIDTGELLNSLRPGYLTKYTYRPPKGQVFSKTGGTILLGTDVSHAKWFHRKRRMWPSKTAMQPWFKAATRDATRHITTILGDLLT